MSNEEFEHLRQEHYLAKVSVNGSVGYVHSFANEHINIQFEGPIPEPFHYSEVEIVQVERPGIRKPK